VAWSLVVAPCVLAASEDEIRPSVVKIFASQSPPNMFMPWKITSPTESTASGVVIEGGRILTNAHAVKYAQQVYVKPNQTADKLDATVEYIAPDCDLATLKVDDPSAIKDLKPVPLADCLPELKAKVNVLGFPTGGDTLSVTEGVVSRIEYVAYYYETGALRIQVDAAVNPGNSGGPAIIDGKLTGVVFSKLKEGENIGYLIPAEVIRHFLDDWKDGKYDGFPKLCLQLNTLENPDLRAYLKLDRQVQGALIQGTTRPELKDIIKPWDVILEMDGIALDNTGMVPLSNGLRVHASYLVSRKPAGSKVKLKLLRKGEKLDVEIATVNNDNSIIQPMTGNRPTYFIYGGLVLTPATVELAQSAGANFWGYLGLTGGLLTKAMRQTRQSPDDQVVVSCGPLIPHKLTKGYEVKPLSVLTHINDQPIKNLRQAIQILRDCKEEFVVFRFEDDFAERIVLSPKRVQQYMPEILQNNNIPSACSDDLKDLWKQP
jgi:S1-C subfamily serine protease